MAKKQIDAMLDAALDYISTNGTELYICTSEPADRAAADTASVVPVQTPSYSANANGDTSGRKKTVQAINDITLDASGTVTHIAICSGTITDAANGIFSADFGPAGNAISDAGEYKFWSVLTLAGKVSISKPTLVYILQEGRLK